jgi:hypothetical protein
MYVPFVEGLHLELHVHALERPVLHLHLLDVAYALVLGIQVVGVELLYPRRVVFGYLYYSAEVAFLSGFAAVHTYISLRLE